MDSIGWDLGGAHLKAAGLSADGRILAVEQLPCPLWRGLEHLESAIEQTLCRMGESRRHAVTMTGELADIFANRNEGVLRLVETMREKLPGAQLQIFSGRRGFVSAGLAAAHAGEIASANWLASARFVAGQVADGVFIDIGSTTTDIVPLCAGVACPHGLTDSGRLASDELVYTGVVRTPVMAVTPRAPFAGQWQRLAAEHFSTMADVHRLTGSLDPAHDMAETADGSGKSPHETARRLARMVGRDLEDAPMAAWEELARYFASVQLQDIRIAMERVLSREGMAANMPVIGAGVGRFMVRELARQLRREFIDFADLVHGSDADRDWAANCAPAFSVAWLAREAGS